MTQLTFDRRQCRGTAVIFIVVLMTLFAGICSLAVDYGHAQLVKTEMQRCADATARSYLMIAKVYGQSYCATYGPQFYSSSLNPVDANWGVAPTVSVVWGSWTAATKTFVPGGTSPLAIKVTISRTAANNNAVPLLWGKLLGANSVDLHASCVAVLMGGDNVNVSVNATSSLYLSGMPSNTTTTYGDNFTNDAPYQVPTIPVTPGTWITVSNLSGSSSVVPGQAPYAGPGGDTNDVVYHNENWDHGTPNSPSSENGIADARLPEDAVTGLFLGPTSPNLTAAPAATVDWTAGSQGNQATYSNITTKQPFMIGTGKTTLGTVKQFLVPPGATRMYIGIWDGVAYNNNAGSFTGTITVQTYVQVVQ